MSMERWNPFRDNFDMMRQAMDRWMDDRQPGNWLGSQQGNNLLSVAVDVRETAQGYELEASLPGVQADDIDIQVERDVVTLRGQSQHQEERREGGNFVYRERRFGSFMRTVRLPEAVDAENVEATLDHGVLKVTLPRLGQQQQRRIQVRSGRGQPATDLPMPGRVELENNPTSLDIGKGGTTALNNTERVENSTTRKWNNEGSNVGANSNPTMANRLAPGPQTPASSSAVTVNNSSASGATGTTPNLQTGALNQPGSTWTPTETPTVGRGAPQTEPAPGEVGPGASSGEHSQVDHRGQTGGQTYTSGGARQSPQDTSTSSGTRHNGQSDGDSGDYGAGQTTGNLSQSQTLGNQ